MPSKKIKLSRTSFIAIFVVAVIVSTIALIPKTYAATKSWDGGGGDNKFSTAANWSGDTLPTNGDSIVFDTTSLSSETTLNNDITGLSLGGISITGANTDYAYEITGNTLTISGSISDDRSAITTDNYGVFFKLPMTLSGDTTLTGTEFENGSINTNGHHLTLQGLSASVTENAAAGVLSGSGALSVTGTGAFLLADNSSYTGAITVSSGATLYTSLIGIQNSTQVTVNGGTLELEKVSSSWDGPVTLSMPMSLSGTLYTYPGYLDYNRGDDSGGDSTLTLDGGVSLNGDLTYLGGDSTDPFQNSVIDTTISAPFTSNGHTITTSPNSFGTISYPASTVPDAPTNLQGTPASGHVALNWTAPASDGGQSITDYIVQYRTHPSGTWNTFNDGTSTTTSADVTGLTNGTTYDFQVIAVNSVGNSAGDVLSSITPVAAPTVPGAPTNLQGTAGSAHVALTWTAPASDGGASITDYVVQYRTSPSGSWTTFNDGTSTTPSADVTGLTNGTSYDFQVMAVNSVGNSTSDVVSSITPVAAATVPDAPTNLQGSPASGHVTLTWTAPVSNGGSSITDYIVQYRTHPSGSWSTFNDGTSSTTGADVTGLTNGTSYDFQVMAVNSIGNSASDLLSSITPTAPLTVPDAPTSLQATPASGHVALSWTAPASNGGSSVTDYIIQYRTHPSGSWTTFNDGTSTTANADVTGLTNGTTYDFQVVAVNSIGNSAGDVISSITPTAALTVPDAVTGLAAAMNGSNVDLTWTAPASNGGSSLTDYLVQFRVTGDISWQTVSHSAFTTNGTTLTSGLTDGNTYDFQITPQNAQGNGPSVTLSSFAYTISSGGSGGGSGGSGGSGSSGGTEGSGTGSGSTNPAGGTVTGSSTPVKAPNTSAVSLIFTHPSVAVGVGVVAAIGLIGLLLSRRPFGTR